MEFSVQHNCVLCRDFLSLHQWPDRALTSLLLLKDTCRGNTNGAEVQTALMVYCFKGYMALRLSDFCYITDVLQMPSWFKGFGVKKKKVIVRKELL